MVKINKKIGKKMVKIKKNLCQLDGLLRSSHGGQHCAGLDLDCHPQEDLHKRAARVNQLWSGWKGDFVVTCFKKNEAQWAAYGMYDEGEESDS